MGRVLVWLKGGDVSQGRGEIVGLLCAFSWAVRHHAAVCGHQAGTVPGIIEQLVKLESEESEGARRDVFRACIAILAQIAQEPQH